MIRICRHAYDVIIQHFTCLVLIIIIKEHATYRFRATAMFLLHVIQKIPFCIISWSHVHSKLLNNSLLQIPLASLPLPTSYGRHNSITDNRKLYNTQIEWPLVAWIPKGIWQWLIHYTNITLGTVYCLGHIWHKILFRSWVLRSPCDLLHWTSRKNSFFRMYKNEWLLQVL
jgi:hypothetical protein